MQVATGTVVNGKIDLEGAPLTEGAKVTVVTRGAGGRFSLTAAREDELLESLAEIERGQFVSLEDLLASPPPGRSVWPFGSRSPAALPARHGGQRSGGRRTDLQPLRRWA
jgi:hypothetical protein